MPDSEELMLLQSKLDDHIEEFGTHVREEHERWDHLITVQETNSRVVGELTIAVTKQAEATKDMIDVWTTGRTLGKIGKYLGSIAILGVCFTWLAEHFKS